MTRPERPDDPRQTGRRTNWTLILLLGGLVLLILVIAYLATSRDSNPDSLTNSEVATSSAPNHEKLCAAKPVYDAIKAELFRRAVQLRGSDQEAYEQVAGAATLRMENPVMESENKSNDTLHCSGSLSIDLPPGVSVADGRRTLMSDVDYNVQAGGSGTLLALSDAEAVVTPLAKLVRAAEPAASAPEDESNDAAPEDEGNSAVPEAAPAPAPPAAQPSFSCADARSRSEAAICADPGLTALDRTMAAQYGRAIAEASPDERDELQNTARRFYAYRDRCGDRQCIADAYVGRMREIRDISQGR